MTTDWPARARRMGNFPGDAFSATANDPGRVCAVVDAGPLRAGKLDHGGWWARCSERRGFIGGIGLGRIWGELRERELRGFHDQRFGLIERGQHIGGRRGRLG